MVDVTKYADYLGGASGQIQVHPVNAENIGKYHTVVGTLTSGDIFPMNCSKAKRIVECMAVNEKSIYVVKNVVFVFGL